MLIQNYLERILPTDRLPKDTIEPSLLGLYGEVGSIMAAAKKVRREGLVYAGYQNAAEEEFGDAFWYFSTLVTRLGESLEEILRQADEGNSTLDELASYDDSSRPLAKLPIVSAPTGLDGLLLDLGKSTADLMSIATLKENRREKLVAFANRYFQALAGSGINFSQVLERNLAKTSGRFLDITPQLLPTFDDGFEPDEKLPDEFRIHIVQRANGQSYLKWNGVFLGDPLTDNIRDPDGYRFHDVFHLAHAAVLHWSPVFRALIKHKRKSDKKIDEAQDGGRAIVVEEGLTAWLFSRAKDSGFFRTQKSLSFDLLKTVGEFVRGYEVEACPLRLWESAILQGYEAFLKVRDNGGGVIIGDRGARTLHYEPLTSERVSS